MQPKPRSADAVNSKPGRTEMSTSSLGLSENLQQYLLDVSLHEPEPCRRLRQQTLAMPKSNMLSSPEQVQLLLLLFKMLDARAGLEVGTFTGYTSLRLTLGMPALRNCCSAARTICSPVSPVPSESTRMGLGSRVGSLMLRGLSHRVRRRRGGTRICPSRRSRGVGGVARGGDHRGLGRMALPPAPPMMRVPADGVPARPSPRLLVRSE